ncbi:MAG: GLPGLI family protein [Flavobacteriaceae bacterium]|nr:GLPGLI family protein [Flavobacteriaceae bacterium]
MRKIIVLIFLLFTTLLFSQQKFSGAIIYNVSLKPRDLSKIATNDKISEKDKQTVSTIIKNTNDVESVLKFTKNESIYKIIDKMESDADQKINLTKVVAGGNSIYYTDNSTNTFLYQKADGGDFWLIDYLPSKWVLTQETKPIGAYLCYKAILNNETNFVWYTPEIPVNFGPQKYHGLPGLVLEVQIGGLLITATKIILNPKEVITLKKPIKGIKITEEEYFKKRENIFNRF